MKGHNPIALAVPFFFLLIGIELLVARARKRQVYRIADALADLGCGVGQQAALVFIGSISLLGYLWAYEHRVLSLSGGTAWLIALFGVDLLYYLWHRASHRVNLLWAAHAVHHQSEDYNLAVALRQAVLTPFTSMPFYMPLALLGVPPLVYGIAASINTLYQFWIHTELVGKLPAPLELVLNTPSHHRVHHAVNAQYLDRNYAGVLIIWDRLFGTFVEEREPCTYGTVKRLATFNALRAQFAELGVIAAKVAGAPAWDRVRVWLMPPEWLPGGPAPIPDPPTTKLETTAPPGLQRYAMVQFGVAVLVTFLMMWFANELTYGELVAPGIFVFAALLTLGLMMDARPLGLTLELVRIPLAAMGSALWLWPRVGPGAVALALLFGAGSLAHLLRARAVPTVASA